MFISRDSKPTDYNLNKLLSYIWHAGKYKRSIKMNNQWYAMCDYERPKNDNTIRFFCVDKSLTDKPYTGEQGASNKTQVSQELYSPTFCLYDFTKQVLMVLQSSGSPTYKSISHYLMKYIKRNFHGHKTRINLIPISSNTKFNSLEKKKYKIEKATFKINPDDLKIQYVNNYDLHNKSNKHKGSFGGFGKIFGSNNNNNGLKATISLTNDESTNLDFNLVNNLRNTLIYDDGVKDFKVKYRQGVLSKTLNVLDPRKSSILADELDIQNDKGKVITESFARDNMYKFFQTPNTEIDSAIKESEYNKKDLISLDDYYVHKQIPKKYIYKGDKNGNKAKNKKHETRRETKSK